MDDIPPLLICVPLLFGILTVGQTPTVAVTELFYEQPRVPDYGLEETEETIVSPLDDINIVETLECMIQMESGGNPEALNPKDTDGLPAYGLLQYKEGTFKRFCVDEYGYPDDLWNPGIQYMCADRMIRSGLGWHWPTFARCSYPLDIAL